MRISGRIATSFFFYPHPSSFCSALILVVIAILGNQGGWQVYYSSSQVLITLSNLIYTVSVSCIMAVRYIPFPILSRKDKMGVKWFNRLFSGSYHIFQECLKCSASWEMGKNNTKYWQRNYTNVLSEAFSHLSIPTCRYNSIHSIKIGHYPLQNIVAENISQSCLAFFSF